MKKTALILICLFLLSFSAHVTDSAADPSVAHRGAIRGHKKFPLPSPDKPNHRSMGRRRRKRVADSVVDSVADSVVDSVAGSKVGC